MKTIVHVINSLAVGGSEISLCRILEYANKHSSDKQIVLYLKPERILAVRLEKANVSVIYIGSLSWLKRVKLIRQLKPGVIQGWLYQSCLVAFIIAKLSFIKPKLIWSFRNSLHLYNKYSNFKKIQLRILALMSRKVEVVLFNSIVSAKQHRELGFTANYKVIPNGFQIKSAVTNNSKNDKLLSKFSIPTNGPIALTIARSHVEKGYKELLAAIEIFIKDNSTVNFVFIGSDVENLFNIYPEFESNKNLINRVYLISEQANIFPFLDIANIVICPSLTESFPNAVGEAMANAIPVISSDVGDASYLVGGTGILVEAGNSIALSKAIEYFFSLTKNERLKLGTNAQLRIKNKFELDNTLLKQYSVY